MHIADIAALTKPAIIVQSAVVKDAKLKLTKTFMISDTTNKMFRRFDITLMSNPACLTPVDNLTKEDFQYYDKDGFELNRAEQKFYAAMHRPINFPILNHCCWQEPWFAIEREDLGLIVDHAMFLCRANYAGKAAEQLEKLKPSIPQVDLLLRTRTKWGFDFALDAIRDGEVFEVIHIEYDSNDYENFTNRFINFEYLVRHTDWVDCANRVWAERDKWKPLKGFEQNHWKAKFLIGWNRAEYLEKAI